MNIKQKFEAVTTHKYCINCLARSHRTKDCTIEKRRSTCNGKHHSTLHRHPRLYTHFAETKGEQKSKPIPSPQLQDGIHPHKTGREMTQGQSPNKSDPKNNHSQLRISEKIEDADNIFKQISYLQSQNRIGNRQAAAT